MTKRMLIIVLSAIANIPAFAQGVDTAWVRIYNGPDSADDEALALGVDASYSV